MDRVAHKKQISRKSNKGLVGCYNSLNNITALNQHQKHSKVTTAHFAFPLFYFARKNMGLTQSQAMNKVSHKLKKILSVFKLK